MQKYNIWDRLAENYLKSVKKDSRADFAYERLVNSLSILGLCDFGNTALDLGCGDGRFTRELETRYQNVYGLDYSKRMVKQAKLICPKTKFIIADLEKKFPNFSVKFNLIVCKLTLMYVDNLENVALETLKILNPGGIFVLSVTHPLKWAVEAVKGNIVDYRGYLLETKIKGTIAKDKHLKVDFANRSIETYINTFRKNGFNVEAVVELGVPDSFVIKYPQYLNSQHRPYRLNIKFSKSA